MQTCRRKEYILFCSLRLILRQCIDTYACHLPWQASATASTCCCTYNTHLLSSHACFFASTRIHATLYQYHSRMRAPISASPLPVHDGSEMDLMHAAGFCINNAQQIPQGKDRVLPGWFSSPRKVWTITTRMTSNLMTISICNSKKEKKGGWKLPLFGAYDHWSGKELFPVEARVIGACSGKKRRLILVYCCADHLKGFAVISMQVSHCFTRVYICHISMCGLQRCRHSRCFGSALHSFLSLNTCICTHIRTYTHTQIPLRDRTLTSRARLPRSPSHAYLSQR